MKFEEIISVPHTHLFILNVCSSDIGDIYCDIQVHWEQVVPTYQ